MVASILFSGSPYDIPLPSLFEVIDIDWTDMDLAGRVKRGEKREREGDLWIFVSHDTYSNQHLPS